MQKIDLDNADIKYSFSFWENLNTSPAVATFHNLWPVWLFLPSGGVIFWWFWPSDMACLQISFVSSILPLRIKDLSVSAFFWRNVIQLFSSDVFFRFLNRSCYLFSFRQLHELSKLLGHILRQFGFSLIHALSQEYYIFHYPTSLSNK